MTVFWDVPLDAFPADIIQWDDWELRHMDDLLEQRALYERYVRVPMFLFLF